MFIKIVYYKGYRSWLRIWIGNELEKHHLVCCLALISYYIMILILR